MTYVRHHFSSSVQTYSNIMSFFNKTHFIFQPDKLGTQWKYEIEWYPGGSSNQFSLVSMNSFPRYGEDDIFVKVWTNADSPSDIGTFTDSNFVLYEYISSHFVYLQWLVKSPWPFMLKLSKDLAQFWEQTWLWTLEWLNQIVEVAIILASDWKMMDLEVSNHFSIQL